MTLGSDRKERDVSNPILFRTLPSLNHLTDLNKLVPKVASQCNVARVLNVAPEWPRLHITNFRVNCLVSIYRNLGLGLVAEA